MENTRIIYRNYWRDGSIYGYSSQHPQHPVIDSQVDTLLQFYRTRYGTDSGNGCFVVDDYNKYIDFDEGGAELTATLTTGEYTGDSLATEIKTQLNSAGALTYSVSYSESTALFTISASGNFTLRWSTGSHIGNDMADTLGYDDSADDTGADSYTSDYRRIHWPDTYAVNDLGSAQNINFIAILNHNISSDATIMLYGASDEDFTTDVVWEEIPYNANNIFYFLTDTAVSRQYWYLKISDPTNPNSYIQYAHIFLGSYIELNKAYSKDNSEGPEDLSEGEYSDSLVFYGEKKESLDAWSLPYLGINSTSKSAVNNMMIETGRIKAWIICFDYSSPNDNSYYVRNSELTKPQYKHKDNWNWTANLVEVL